MFRLLWAMSVRIRYFLRRYMPTNVLLDLIRTRRGLKWGIPAMLLAAPYLLAASICTSLIADGGPGWLNLLVFLFVWNPQKFVVIGPVSVVLLGRVRIQEAMAQHRSATEHGQGDGTLTGGERELMTVAIYTRNAVPNPAGYEWQREACEELAVELGYEGARDYHDEGQGRPALDVLLADVRDHRVQGLVVASLDRLGRTFDTFSHVMATLNDAGVPLYVVGRGRVDTATSPELGIMRALADYEATSIEHITH